MHSGPADTSALDAELELEPVDPLEDESAARAELAPPRTSAVTTTESDRTRLIVTSRTST
jgi:hypothetical protein